MMALQVVVVMCVKDFSWPMLILASYCIGGVINHSLMLGRCHTDLFNKYANLIVLMPTKVRNLIINDK